ncbi:MAG: sigma-70 family RNA polymerase sigma factor [Phycisphaera sp.]|nr:sigma-70 family RNA polymerase sigma factor [Phycisphaera sp.]
MHEQTQANDDALEPGPPVGKGPAFLRLFVEGERRIYAYILTLVPNRADAQDILQETSVVLWEKFDPDNPPEYFVAWAKKIAYHKVLDMRKKRGRSRVVFNETVLEAVSATATTMSNQIDDRDGALADCVEKLPERDRHLLECRFRKGSTTKSTAAEVGRSLEAVYKALSRIRQGLYDCVTSTLAAEGRA